jgi:putative pyruvate formate lyase activating enzyme
MSSRYEHCLLCGRACGADRLAGGSGTCGESAVLRVASASIHRGEEPPITGRGGSGTIFFTGCALRCRFCQNRQISREGMGAFVERNEFASICLALQDRGAENVNLVTGSHFLPSLAEGLAEARRRGLRLPVLWNSSGYDKRASLALVDPYLATYLPDLKTLDPALAASLFGAPDYPAVAREAVTWMAERHPLAIEGGILVSGVIVRHLVLPGLLENTRRVIGWFAENLAGKALFSLMTQYTPIASPENANPDETGRALPFPDRYLDRGEYDAALAMLDEHGIEDGYYQELKTGDDWLPDFRRANPFPSELSVPVWHWKTGFSALNVAPGSSSDRGTAEGIIP